MCTIIEKLVFSIRPKKPIRSCLFIFGAPYRRPSCATIFIFPKILHCHFSGTSQNLLDTPHFQSKARTNTQLTSSPNALRSLDSMQGWKNTVSEKECSIINDLSAEIVALTICDGKTSHLSYTSSSFHRIFKVYWLKKVPRNSYIMKKLDSKYFYGQNAQSRNEELQIFVHHLVGFKYINITQKISSFLLRTIVNNTSFCSKNIEIYNDLIDFFSLSGRDKIVNSVLKKMTTLNVKPNVMTYNILAKNCLAVTDLNIERLQIWKRILLEMKAKSIRPDLVSWYMTLALLKPGLKIKSSFEDVMVKSGLTHNSKFNDIKLVDMVDTDMPSEKILQYYNRQQRACLDVNCMNTVIFQLLNEHGLYRAWNFMRSEASHKSVSIQPACSTVSVFVKYCSNRGDLEQIIRLLNTLRYKYGLVNYNSHQIVLAYLLKFPDGCLPFWYPLLVKYFLRYDATYGFNRYRHLNSLISNFKSKLERNFPYIGTKNSSKLLCSIKLEISTKFEDIFFANMRRLFVEEANHKQIANIHKLSISNPKNLVDREGSIFEQGELDFSPNYNNGKEDEWIKDILQKSKGQLIDK